MQAYRHDLIAGHPVLDFLNSVNDWTSDSPREYLTDLGQAIAFGVATRLITRAEGQALHRRSSERTLDELRALRALLERVFRAQTGGGDVGSADLAALAGEGAAAAAAASLQQRRGRLVRRIEVARGGGATLRWRLTDAAISLLMSTRIDRLKDCPSCGWFFLDETKNRSRRWCSMSTCGSSAKSRAYYERSRGRRP